MTTELHPALECGEIEQFVDAYLDNEFGAEERTGFEAHVARCSACRHKVRVQTEWRQSVRMAMSRERAPAGLRGRIVQALAKEPVPLPTWRRWASRTLPAAAAAGLVASLLVSKVPWSPVAADAISNHQRNLPVEVTGGNDQVRQWYAGKVDFPVRMPTFANGSSRVALRGGRLTHIHDREAAELMFDVDGNKVSVFIFDPGDLSIQGQHKELIGNREVYFDQERGYNVAMYRDNGIGYAITSDLDRNQMVKLISAAVAR